MIIVNSGKSETSQYNFIIIGGGIVGASIAYHLGKSDKSVLLVDAEHQGKATKAGAGIISGPTTFSQNKTLYQLVKKASKYYPEFVEELEDKVDRSTSYEETTQVILALEEDNIDKFEEITNRIQRRQKKEGYPPEDTINNINPNEFMKKYPHISRPLRVLEYTASAKVEGQQITDVICEAARKEGVTTKLEKVDKLIFDEDKCTGIAIGDTIINGEMTIIAGGAWSTQFSKQLDYEISVYPQRGQIIHLKYSEKNGKNWPIINAMNEYYSLTWDNDTIVIGATREDESGFQPHNTVEGVLTILQEGKHLIPQIADAQITEIRIGLRPYSKDKLPIIGPIPTKEKVWLATGHGPLGLTAGPFTGKIVASKLLYHEEIIDMSKIHPQRFRK